MRKVSAFTSLILLVSIFVFPQANAAGVKLGAVCTRVGELSVLSGTKIKCVKSGNKLVWKKVAATPKPSPKPSPSPTPTPISKQMDYYVAKDQKNVQRLEAYEGCANPANTIAEVQVLVDGKWLPIKSIKSGWTATPNACLVAQLGKKDSLAWADVYVDEGATIRWYFNNICCIFKH